MVHAVFGRGGAAVIPLLADLLTLLGLAIAAVGVVIVRLAG